MMCAFAVGRSILFFRFFVSAVADEGFSLFYSLPPWRKPRTPLVSLFRWGAFYAFVIGPL